MYGYKRKFKKVIKKNFRKTPYKNYPSPTTMQLYKRDIIGVPAGAPNVRTVKLRYSQTIGLTSTSGSVGYHVFRASSIHDPDYTTTGHQPMGHDTWQTLYDYYTVISSKITVKFAEDAATKGLATYCGIYLQDQTPPLYTDVNNLIENNGNCKINIDQRVPIVINDYYSAKKFWNLKDIRDNTDNIGAHFGANPTLGAYFFVYIATMDGAVTNNMLANVTIEYLVTLSKPKHGVAS